MFVKLDEAVISLLRCPLCKSSIRTGESDAICDVCGSVYPKVKTQSGGHAGVYDFRIHKPSYIIPKATETWQSTQTAFEASAKYTAESDDLRHYLDEIDSVRDIYETEFEIMGDILDVGGSLGTLRHYLCEEPNRIYVCIDPSLNGFDQIPQRSNLLKAYPCLSVPCNFLCCYAENLPFDSGCFDWVHMRSVVDHFEDPYLAFKEAYRVLKPKGKVMVGLSILERQVRSTQSVVTRTLHKIKNQGVLPALKAIVCKIKTVGEFAHDDHIFRLRYVELLDLLSVTKFHIEKEHWQKAPFSHVIYVSARRTPEFGSL